MSNTPKLKNDDDENISEATTTCNSKYKWMILIGRLKSLTKIEGLNLDSRCNALTYLKVSLTDHTKAVNTIRFYGTRTGFQQYIC